MKKYTPHPLAHIPLSRTIQLSDYNLTLLQSALRFHTLKKIFADEEESKLLKELKKKSSIGELDGITKIATIKTRRLLTVILAFSLVN